MSIVLSEAQKEEKRVLARQYAELMKEEYVDPFPPEQQQPDPNLPIVQQINPDDLTEEQLLAIVNKRNGTTLTSLEALKPQPTAEEIESKKREREAAMFSFGLTSGKFKQEDYDAYQQAKGNKLAVVRSEVVTQFTAAFPDLLPDAIEEKVANYFFENLDPADAMRIAREKELLTLADVQINSKYKNIIDLPNDYAQHEEGLNKESNFQRKVQATLPVYTADVNKALQSLQHFTVDVPDTKNPANTVTVPLEYADNDLKEVADLLLTNDQVNKAVAEGTTFEQIKEIADFILWKKHGPRLISQASKKYNSIQKENYIAGRKGLLNNGQEGLDVSQEDQKTPLDEQYDQMIASAPK